MLLNPFKGFIKVDNLDTNYLFSAKILNKSDEALYTKVGGDFNTKCMIKTISKEQSKTFTPE